jgi:hypothetical protein
VIVTQFGMPAISHPVHRCETKGRVVAISLQDVGAAAAVMFDGD